MSVNSEEVLKKHPKWAVGHLFVTLLLGNSDRSFQVSCDCQTFFQLLFSS